jgi:hypothetical protein
MLIYFEMQRQLSLQFFNWNKSRDECWVEDKSRRKLLKQVQYDGYIQAKSSQKKVS